MSLFGQEEATKVFLYSKPADMRKGFEGLYGLVLEHMQMDPRNGYLFVFFNIQRNRIKVLHWNQDGLAIFHKRLERGTFKRPSARVDAPNSELLKEELFMILRGIDFEKTKRCYTSGLMGARSPALTKVPEDPQCSTASLHAANSITLIPKLARIRFVCNR